MNKDNLILLGAAAVAYWIITKPVAAVPAARTKPLPTTGDFARMDRMQAPPDTVGALGEPVQVFPNAIWV